MSWLYKLQRKYGRYYIPDLMRNLIFLMATVYLVTMITGFNLSGALVLSREGLFSGQVWRLLTFICVPPGGSILSIALQLYFYYLIGSALENEWGSFIFNAYYLIGMLGCIAAALLTGYASNTFLNLSLFFAFAILFPEFEVLLFFILPVKIKYIAIIDAVIYIAYLLLGSWSDRACILFSLINVFLFFGKDFIKRIKSEIGYAKVRRNFRSESNRNQRGW